MSTVRVRDCDIYYEETGSGAETILFSHGLLLDHTTFEAQIKELSRNYRCIAFHHRGQGKSELTKSGYDLESLALDTIELIKALKIGPCHLVGHSQGGMVALRVALQDPHVLKSLILIGSSADKEKKYIRYNLMVIFLQLFGVKPLVPQVLPIMFGKTFNRSEEMKDVREKWRNYISTLSAKLVPAIRGVVDRTDIYPELKKIKIPTLIIVGDEDLSTRQVASERIHDQIKNSKLVVMNRVGHSPVIEKPDLVNKELRDFLANVEKK